MNNIFHMVIDAIFRGSLVLIPILFIIHFTKVKVVAINKTTLIQAANCMLLAGSALYILTLIAQICIGIFSGGDYEQYTYINSILGEYWLDFGAYFVLANALLPQLLWIKNLRKGIVASFIIISNWGLTSMVVNIFSPPAGWHITVGNPWFGYLKWVMIYLIIISLMYVVLNRKQAIQPS